MTVISPMLASALQRDNCHLNLINIPLIFIVYRRKISRLLSLPLSLHLSCLNLHQNDLTQKKQRNKAVMSSFSKWPLSVNSQCKLNYQLQKQIYRGDDGCIDFGAQMLRYSKKETTSVFFNFYFVYGLNEREMFW